MAHDVLDTNAIEPSSTHLADFIRETDRPSARPTYDDLVTRARQAIAAGLADGRTGLDDVARALGLSSRTVQRRLHDKHQSVSRLADDVRRERVMQLLADGVSTKTIAVETGFGDVPALYRAFRRWTGTTPRRYGRAAVEAIQAHGADEAPAPESRVA